MFLALACSGGRAAARAALARGGGGRAAAWAALARGGGLAAGALIGAVAALAATALAAPARGGWTAAGAVIVVAAALVAATLAALACGGGKAAGAVNVVATALVPLLAAAPVVEAAVVVELAVVGGSGLLWPAPDVAGMAVLLVSTAIPRDSTTAVVWLAIGVCGGSMGTSMAVTPTAGVVVPTSIIGMSNDCVMAAFIGVDIVGKALKTSSAKP